MTMEKDVHLDESQILWSIVDESELPVALRKHLAGCASCRNEKQRLEGSLTRVSQMARDFAPAPVRKVGLPAEKVRRFRNWSWQWPDVRVLGTVAAALILIVFGSLMLRSAPENQVALTDQEMQEDARLLTVVSSLEENALPLFYLEMSVDPDSEFDDDFMDFMDFVVPMSDDGTLS